MVPAAIIILIAFVGIIVIWVTDRETTKDKLTELVEVSQRHEAENRRLAEAVRQLQESVRNHTIDKDIHLTVDDIAKAMVASEARRERTRA